MNKKKKLPITILKSLESFVNLTGEKFKIIDPKENLLHVLDIDSTSDFYFKIEKYEKKQNGSFQFLMNRKPTNEHENGNHRTWIDIKNLEPQFKSWINLLDQYETIESFFDDPIVKSNAERFFQKFDIIDENADKETFDLEQQLFLEEYLINSRKKLEKLKKGKTKEQVIEIEILENETEEIQSALTVESKKKIMVRLSKFWGRAQKTGLQVIKEIFVSVTAELAKRLMLGP
ncbi:hypothetical protein KZY98_14250 [Croceibacter atlanticus]|uniref:hypothetical protein n=1 Tax=Croceibacter atlanticus TaxID=313588 RepID=UPI001C5D6CC6|nr:hypothetical protein [Croceibacter atlanticus]MBW4971623.1 hypothetical protein [Croceibacter atlanticus]